MNATNSIILLYKKKGKYIENVEDVKQYESYLPKGIQRLEMINMKDEINNSLDVLMKKEQ